MCVCARVCVHACVCMCVCVCGGGGGVRGGEGVGGDTARFGTRESPQNTEKERRKKNRWGETQHSVRSPLAQTKRVQMYK